MKKITFLTLLGLLIFNGAHAQKLSIGGEFGISSSISNQFNLSNVENRRNSFYSGLNVTFQFNEKISFSSGIHYLRQGYQFTTCYEFNEGVENLLVGKLDYLIVPTVVNFHLLTSKKLIVNLGLLSGYNIQAIQDYPEPNGGCEIFYPRDIKNVTQNFSISGQIGIAYKIYQGNGLELIPSLKYVQGISNSFHNRFATLANVNTIYNSALFTVGVNYSFGKRKE